MPSLLAFFTPHRASSPESPYRLFLGRGTSCFCTVNLAGHGQGVRTDHTDLLRQCQQVALRCKAVVVLPDHLHAVWTQTPGDADFSGRWRKIKARFSQALGRRFATSHGTPVKREVGLWPRLRGGGRAA